MTELKEQETNCLSTELLQLRDKLDVVSDQVKETFNDIGSRDGNVDGQSKKVAKLIKEIRNRSCILQKYADTVLESGKAIYSQKMKFENEKNERILQLNKEESELRAKLTELRGTSISISKQKTQLSKLLTKLTTEITELTTQDSILESANLKHAKTLRVNIVAAKKTEQQQFNEDSKHYKQLIQDAEAQCEHMKYVIGKREEYIEKVKADVAYNEKFAESLENVCELYSSLDSVRKEMAQINEQREMYVSEIMRKKNKIEKAMRKKVEVLENLENEMKYGPSLVTSRSTFRQQVLEDEHSFIAEELNKSASLLKSSIEIKEKQYVDEDNLMKELDEMEKELNKMNSENEKLFTFAEDLDRSIDLSIYQETEDNDKAEELARELHELMEMLRKEINDSPVSLHEIPEENIDLSKEVIAEKNEQSKHVIKLEMSLSEAQNQVSKMNESISKAEDYIEKLEAEKLKLGTDCRNIRIKRGECKILSNVNSSNMKRTESKLKSNQINRAGRIIKLTQTVSELESLRNSKVEELNVKKDNYSMKQRSLNESQSISMMRKTIGYEQKSDAYSERVSTAERVAKVITNVCSNVSTQLNTWNTKNKSVDSSADLNEWNKKLDRLIKRSDDLTTWVQVFGKHNVFRYK